MFTGEQIRKKRKQLRMSVEELALLLGTKPDNIYKWERGGKPQTGEMDRKIEDWLAGRLENVPRETETGQIASISKNEGEGARFGEVPKNDQELTRGALFNLTVSDQLRSSAEDKRAAAEKDRAAAELIREQNNKRIIDHLTTAGAQQESSQALDAILPGLQRILVKFGMGRLWKSEKDGQLEVSKLLFGNEKKSDTKHTHDGAHR